MSTTVKVKIKDLGLADIIQLWDDGGYGTATVIQVTKEYVKAFRPYVHTGDFSYTGGVIPYIGFEEIKFDRMDREVTLLRKSEPLK